MAGRLPLAAWGPRGALSARQPRPPAPDLGEAPGAAGSAPSGSRPSSLWPGVLTSGGLQATRAVGTERAAVTPGVGWQ